MIKAPAQRIQAFNKQQKEVNCCYTEIIYLKFSFFEVCVPTFRQNLLCFNACFEKSQKRERKYKIL